MTDSLLTFSLRTWTKVNFKFRILSIAYLNNLDSEAEISTDIIGYFDYTYCSQFKKELRYQIGLQTNFSSHKSYKVRSLNRAATNVLVIYG